MGEFALLFCFVIFIAVAEPYNLRRREMQGGGRGGAKVAPQQPRRNPVRDRRPPARLGQDGAQVAPQQPVRRPNPDPAVQRGEYIPGRIAVRWQPVEVVNRDPSPPRRSI